MDAVGDGGDGDLFDGRLRPEELPHIAADVAVEFAHAVGVGAEADGQDSHRVLAAPGQLLGGKLDKGAAVDAELAPILPEELLDQLEGEGVVAGGHGRVGRKDGVGTGGFDGLGEGEALALHQLAHALEAEEGAVALVHVPDGGAVAEGTHGAHAADAEDDLLADAHLAVAAVEAGAELAVLRGVAVDVGVHQVDGDAADLDAPDLGIDGAAGQVDVDQDRLALRVERRVTGISAKSIFS